MFQSVTHRHNFYDEYNGKIIYMFLNNLKEIQYLSWKNIADRLNKYKISR